MDNTLKQCDCTVDEQLAIPDITFNMGGTRYTIPRDEWYVRNAEHNKCVIKIMHSPVKVKWALGLNFMTSYYTVFDYKNQRVGLADSKKKGRAHSK